MKEEKDNQNPPYENSTTAIYYGQNAHPRQRQRQRNHFSRPCNMKMATIFQNTTRRTQKGKNRMIDVYSVVARPPLFYDTRKMGKESETMQNMKIVLPREKKKRGDDQG